MMLVSPFPAAHVAELHRWLNAPREPNFDDGDASDAASVAASLARKSAGGGQTFAAIVNDEPIGFIGFSPDAPNAGMFCGMVMAPEHRGRGHGARFLALVVAVLRAQGFRSLAAAVRPDNAAIHATFGRAGAVEWARVYAFGEVG